MILPPELFLAFFLSATLLALVPGPDNIFVLSQSVVYGARAGLLVTLGLCTGLVMHTSLVALGLAALLAASANGLLLIKLLGVTYLLYLAWMSWFAGGRAGAAKPAVKLGGWQLYRRGIIMNATNPKVALFFLAFLPQFVDVRYGPVTLQIVQFGLLFILSTIMVFGAIALLAGRFSERLNRSASSRQLLNRAVSVIFVLLAFNLLVDYL